MKTCLWVSDQVQQKLGCTAAEDGYVGFRKQRHSTIYVGKTKTVMSCTVTAQLDHCLCFANAKSRCSHDMAQFMLNTWAFMNRYKFRF